MHSGLVQTTAIRRRRNCRERAPSRSLAAERHRGRSLQAVIRSQTELWNVASCVFFLWELFCLGSRSPEPGSRAFSFPNPTLGVSGLGGHRGGARRHCVLRFDPNRGALRTGRCCRLLPGASSGRRTFDVVAARDGTSPLSVALADNTDGGRTVERRACLHVRTRSGRTRHGFRHCRLPLSPGANPPPCAAGEDRCQCVDPRQRRIGRKGRPHRSNWSGLWLVARQPAAFASCRTPGADGRRDGSGHRRHFSGTAGRNDLRRRGDVQFPGV